MHPLSVYVPVAQAIARLLAPHAEVVIHDLAKCVIFHIEHPLSPRKAGDESLLDLPPMEGEESSLWKPYPKTNWDGRSLRSISAPLQDPIKKERRGLLCINYDLTLHEQTVQWLQGFLECGREQPAPLFQSDWKERIHAFIHQTIEKKGWSFSTLNREQKRVIVQALRQEGAFDGKKAAEYIAQILRISRASVYNYIQEGEIR